MSDHELRQVLLSTEDLARSIAFYTETLGFPLKFRDGDRYAAIDAGAIVIALAVPADHPIPGEVVLGIETVDVDRATAGIECAGGTVVRPPYDDLHERRGVVSDPSRNGLVLYQPYSRRLHTEDS